MKRYTEEELIVEGSREAWFEKCRVAMSKLTEKIQVRPHLWQLEGSWMTWIPPGDESILISIFPEGEGRTRIHIKASADVSFEWCILTLGYGTSIHHKVPEKFKRFLY
jgi:hypothetical protein